MKITDYPLDKFNNVQSMVHYVRTHSTIIDPFIIADNYNISVSFVDMNKPYAFNVYNPESNTYSIYISNQVDKYSAKILCAHELGHIFCEKLKTPSLFDHKQDPVSEYTANLFASGIVPFSTRFKQVENTTIEEFNEFVESLIYKKNNN